MEKSQLTLLTCKDFYHTCLGYILVILLKPNPTGCSYWDLSNFSIVLELSDDKVGFFCFFFLLVGMDLSLSGHLNPSILNLRQTVRTEVFQYDHICLASRLLGAHGLQ